MDILIVAIIAILIGFLLIYLVDQIKLAPPFSVVARVLIVLVVILFIVRRAGLV